jgi:hypothetical protein
VKICFVFVTLACLALSFRIGYAGEPHPSPARQGGVERAPDQFRDRSDDHTAGKEKTSRGAAPAALRVAGSPKSQEHSEPSNAPNPRQNLEGSPPHARSAPIQNARSGHPMPVRPLPGLSRPAVPPLTSLHHRGANPAVITGSAQVANRNTGKLDGAEVHRRP